jgi:hypothetical protein
MTTPSSVIWWSDPDGTYRLGSNGVLGMPHGDGFTDGFNTIQGARSYDGESGAWTTPDAYAGEVDDPMSQKNYIWNRNNSMAYSDPSGYDSVKVSYFIAEMPVLYLPPFGIFVYKIYLHAVIFVYANDNKTIKATYSYGPDRSFIYLNKDFNVQVYNTHTALYSITKQDCPNAVCPSEAGMKKYHDEYKDNTIFYDPDPGLMAGYNPFGFHNSNYPIGKQLQAGGIGSSKPPGNPPGSVPDWPSGAQMSWSDIITMIDEEMSEGSMTTAGSTIIVGGYNNHTAL